LASAGASAQAATVGAAAPGAAEGALFWLRWAAALGLCLLLAWAGAYALKARQSGSAVPLRFVRPRWMNPLAAAGPRRLRRVESLRISPQLEVTLLECDDRELLLATTPQGAMLLKEGPKTAV
jgi:flagellar biogenesis protein FliO